MPPPRLDTQDAARTGTVGGIYANSTSVATKTNTPLINTPQSLTVVTKDFIRDQGAQSVTDVTRYIPGVAVHQGEGNRDELVIRGVDSSANFFVNGFRDDVQFYRDLYNIQSIELLRGPSALTFGRGVGGGLLNRTLKEAEFRRIYEVTAQTGSFANRRVTLDAGQAINQDFAVRLNAMYEGSDTAFAITATSSATASTRRSPGVRPSRPRCASATNTSTTTAPPTAAIPRRAFAPRRRHRPASIRPRRSHRMEICRRSSAART